MTVPLPHGAAALPLAMPQPLERQRRPLTLQSTGLVASPAALAASASPAALAVGTKRNLACFAGGLTTFTDERQALRFSPFMGPSKIDR